MNSTAQNTNRKRGATKLRLLAVYLLLYSVVPLTGVAQVINRAEYFIDADPGKGNATAVMVSSPAATVNFNFNASTSGLSNGFHILGFRIRQSGTGFWSHAQYSSFYIVPPVTIANAANLTKGEYFFDADPGF